MRSDYPDEPAHEDPAFAPYIEQLVVAVLGPDVPAIRRLMAHPLARGLPRAVREEALVITRAPGSLRAPIHTLGFFHRMSQLMCDDGSAGAIEGAATDWMASESFDDAATLEHEELVEQSVERDPRQMELFGAPEAGR